MLKWLFRMFAKITAAIPTLLYFRYKKYHEKKHPKTHIKGGSIVISNHTSIIDYFTMMYLTFFKHMRCLVSEEPSVSQNSFITGPGDAPKGSENPLSQTII